MCIHYIDDVMQIAIDERRGITILNNFIRHVNSRVGNKYREGQWPFTSIKFIHIDIIVSLYVCYIIGISLLR